MIAGPLKISPKTNKQKASTIENKTSVTSSNHYRPVLTESTVLMLA